MIPLRFAASPLVLWAATVLAAACLPPALPATVCGPGAGRGAAFGVPRAPLRGLSEFGRSVRKAVTRRGRQEGGLVGLRACSTARRHVQSSVLTEVMGAAGVRCCPSCFSRVEGGRKAKFCSSCGSRLGIEGGDAVVHWKPSQARKKQFKNSDVGVSSCGICSVLSMLAMIKKVDKDSPEAEALVQEMEPLVKKRACDVAGSHCRYTNISLASQCSVGLRDHLVGRSECGSSGSEALISKVEGLFPDVIGAAVRIGETLPVPEDALLEWIAEWMRDGAALAVTYSRQNADIDWAEMADTWHAQGVCSVDLVARTVGLTNPVRNMTEEEIVRALPSEAVIHVRGSEVLLHCRGMSDEEVLAIEWPNELWEEMGVTEQIMMLRDMYPGDTWPSARETIVTVPYAGTGVGVGPCFRMFALRDSKAGLRMAAAASTSDAASAEM